MKNGKPSNALNDQQLADLLDELVGLQPDDAHKHILAKVGDVSQASRVFNLLEAECQNQDFLDSPIHPDEHLRGESFPENPKGIVYGA